MPSGSDAFATVQQSVGHQVGGDQGGGGGGDSEDDDDDVEDGEDDVDGVEDGEDDDHDGDVSPPMALWQQRRAAAKVL